MPELPDLSAATGRVRRLRTRGLDPLVIVSVAMVLATVVFALLTFAHPGSGTERAPRNVSFSAALRGCPPSGSGPVIRVGSLGTASGAISVRTGSGAPTNGGAVHPWQSTDVATNGQPQMVSVNGPAAAGLVVGLVGTGPLTGTRCTEPASDYWFTGLGAASTHDSVIQIDNPADTSAEVLLTTYSSRLSDQPADDDRVLAPHSSLSLDLFRNDPRYGTFAVHAAVVQGQAEVSVLDQTQVPGSSTIAEWLVPQSAPSGVVTLLGVPQAGRQTLTVANPGADQLTATVRLITRTSIFAPAKFAGVTVPGSGVATADLSKILAGAKDVVGIEVDAPTPVTASLGSVVGNDLAYSGADPLLTAEGGAVVPDGAKSVVISPASAAGSVNVIGRDASGKVVFNRPVAVSTSSGAAVDLPAGAVLVQIQTNKLQVRAAVVVTGNGAVVIPVGRVIRVSTVPYVRPGLG